jgi:hypothetical protein
MEFAITTRGLRDHDGLEQAISGLPKMHGYLHVEDLVTPIRFPAIAVPKRCLSFVERPHKTKPARPRVETPPEPEVPEGPALPPVNPQNEFSFLG